MNKIILMCVLLVSFVFLLINYHPDSKDSLDNISPPQSKQMKSNEDIKRNLAADKIISAKEITPQNIIPACLMLAAQTYSVPSAILVGIYTVEGGAIGGSYKENNLYLGLTKINSKFVPELAKFWNVDNKKAEKWIVNDACTNFGVLAWLLREQIDKTGSLSKAITAYYTKNRGGNLKEATKYKESVIQAMKEKGLVKETSKPELNIQSSKNTVDRVQKNYQKNAGSISAYEIEVAHNDELFIINGEKYEAQTFCFDMEEGDMVIFIEGNELGACLSAKFLNLRTRESCEVWCD